MTDKPLVTGIVLILLLAIGTFLFFQFGEYPIQEALSRNNPQLRKAPSLTHRESALLRKRPIETHRQTDKLVLNSAKGDVHTAHVRPMPEPIDQNRANIRPVRQPQYVEEIKQSIYERNIEYVEQIPLLDDLVQTGDKDTRQFWGDGWTSVDDWKKDENGFVLEKRADGTMVFQPDAVTASKYSFFQSPQPYRYDAENREFVNEVDYYGKTIYNVVKFINDDVLVMMTISGRKVDLNIYQKNANQGAGMEAVQVPSSRPGLIERSALQPGS